MLFAFAACGNNGAENGKVPNDRLYDDRDLEDKFEDLFEKPEFEDDAFEDMGRSVSQIVAEHGKMTLSEWVNGPVYRFGDNDYWHAFSEYEITDNGYEPKGECNCVIIPLYELIDTPDDIIDEDVLVELSDSKVSKGFDDMEGMHYYELTHKKFKITVYTDQYGELSGDSSARVTFK